MCAADLCDILRCSVYSYVLTSSRGDLESTELQPVAPPAEPRQAVQPARPRHLQRYSQARVLAAADRGQCVRCVGPARNSAGQCVGRRTADNASLPRQDSRWWSSYVWWWLGDVTPTASDDVTAECEEEGEEAEFDDPVCDPSTMERLKNTCEVRHTQPVWLLFHQWSAHLFWPWEKSNYPSRSCNGPHGPKGPKFKQNKKRYAACMKFAQDSTNPSFVYPLQILYLTPRPG